VLHYAKGLCKKHYNEEVENRELLLRMANFAGFAPTLTAHMAAVLKLDERFVALPQGLEP